MYNYTHFREGEEWSIRRKTLNKVFLKQAVISEYTSVFNEVISDMLSNWNDKLVQGDKDNGVLINDLENQLYKWSIECELPVYYLFLPIFLAEFFSNKSTV